MEQAKIIKVKTPKSMLITEKELASKSYERHLDDDNRLFTDLLKLGGNKLSSKSKSFINYLDELSKSRDSWNLAENEFDVNQLIARRFGEWCRSKGCEEVLYANAIKNDDGSWETEISFLGDCVVLPIRMLIAFVDEEDMGDVRYYANWEYWAVLDIDHMAHKDKFERLFVELFGADIIDIDSITNKEEYKVFEDYLIEMLIDKWVDKNKARLFRPTIGLVAMATHKAKNRDSREELLQRAIALHTELGEVLRSLGALTLT